MAFRLPTATPAPEVLNKRFIIIPYIYVLALVFLAVWQLIIFPDFLTYIADYLGGGVTVTTTYVAVVIVALEVFAVPFLLRLRLSPLARMCSAIAALLVPMVWSVVTLVSQTFMSAYLLADLLFMVWGALSFWLLDGQKALRVKL